MDRATGEGFGLSLEGTSLAGYGLAAEDGSEGFEQAHQVVQRGLVEFASGEIAADKG